MQIYNGAVARVPIVMVDATDDETPETGLTVQVFLSKNGAALTSVINGFAEVGQGLYYASLTAAETNTDGFLFILATASGADIWRDYHEIVSSVATPTGVATREQVTDTIWNRVLTASPTSAGTSGLMVAQMYATMTTGPLASVSGVVNSVTANVATITGVTNSVGIRTGTGDNQLNTSSGRVGINWGDIINPGATTPRVDLWAWNGTAPLPLSSQRVQVDVGAVTNDVTAAGNLMAFFNSTGYNAAPSSIGTATHVATVNFVASVSAAVLSNVGTVTGITNTVVATLSKAVRSMIADDWLARSIAGGSDGGRTNQDAMRLLRNRRSLTFGTMNTATLTAFQENDSTPAWTAIVSTGSAVGLTDVDAS